jgi:hypothetical protein
MADQAYDSAVYWETAQTNDTGFHSVTAGRDQSQVIVAPVSGVKLFLSVICINWIFLPTVRLRLTCVILHVCLGFSASIAVNLWNPLQGYKERVMTVDILSSNTDRVFYYLKRTGSRLIPIIKPTRCTDFSNLFLEYNSTCCGQVFCPSSGV